MEIRTLDLPGVKLVRPRRLGDDRGWFCEVYNTAKFADAGILDVFVQDNVSLSQSAGTVRGLHYQHPPKAQAKLVGVQAGRIFDVVVDVRRGSPHYGRWIREELDASEGWLIYVPVGFLHGFVTLEPNTRVAYKVSSHYAPDCDGAIRWNDPHIGVDWGLNADSALLSDKDAQAPFLANFDSPFVYDPEHA